MLPILESYGLELRQQIIVNKGMQAISGRATKKYRMFPNVTESILFLSKDPKPFIKEFLKNRQKELHLTAKEINDRLGVKSNGGGMWSIYTGKNICEQVPTRELWEKLQAILQFDLQYDTIKQTFNTEMGITDVWDDIDFYHEKGRIHPTQKPLKLINRLVLASSDRNDVVLDPFMGSGTTAVACVESGRRYIGFESDTEYYRQSQTRLAERQMSLFD
jgi:DNA modification methylase